MNGYRFVANALTGARALASLALVARPSLALLAAAIASDWIDGSLARRAGDTSYGARFDLEADSLLTLGLAVAAVRSGAPIIAVVAPLTRYAAVLVRDPAGFSRAETIVDRTTGGPLMAVLMAWIAPPPHWRLVRALIGPVTLARCAAIAALTFPDAVHRRSTERSGPRPRD